MLQNVIVKIKNQSPPYNYGGKYTAKLKEGKTALL